jgi:hypothetical protein
VKIFLHLICLLAASICLAQNHTGYFKGDKAFVRFLSTHLKHYPFNADTPSYHFTIACLRFDKKGGLDTVTYMNDGNTVLKEWISPMLKSSSKDWNPLKNKNKIILIPFEFRVLGKNDEVKADIKHKMIAEDFYALFKSKKALNVVLV